jgi:aspartate/methionine/tyrosine aminotransferase
MDKHTVDRLVERSRSIIPSSLHEVHRIVEQRGPGIVRLHIGEPYIGIPESVREAFIKAIRDGHSQYCDAPGLFTLREAISAHLEMIRQSSIPPERIFVTPGSCQAIAAVLLSLAFDGGTVLLPELHWPMHLQQILMAGLRPRFYRNTESNASFVEALDDAYQPGACALIINSPSNPAGQVLDLVTMNEIYQWAQRRGISVISDEAYEDFLYEGDPCVLAKLDEASPKQARIVFSVHTFSKSFSLTGYRLGYVTAPTDERAHLLRRVQEAMLVSPSTPVQFAGLEALRDSDHLRKHRAYVSATRDEVVRLLSSADLLWNVPCGGWYALVDLQQCSVNADMFSRSLLDEAGVALAPGSAFLPANHPLGARLARVALCCERTATVRGIELLVDWSRNQIRPEYDVKPRAWSFPTT